MGVLSEARDYNSEHVMQWLAKFHAATWKKSTNGVQPIGSYWHLDTRPSEWEDIPRSGWEGRLKLAARAIDNRLKRDPLQCWIHGDTKDANILSARNKQEGIAFCDFQYCGGGPPSKDLAYYCVPIWSAMMMNEQH
jgi:Ser/Thr protein kinase RdoA (MazF antagonist)